ncbi:hypothetical protein BGW38_006601, partial [Lunasporangiospora selenospora]
MQLRSQLRSVAILTAIGATVFYISLWSRLEDRDEAISDPSSTAHSRTSAQSPLPQPINTHETNDDDDKPITGEPKGEPKGEPNSEPNSERVSENNARVAALHTTAFVSFCASAKAKERVALPSTKFSSSSPSLDNFSTFQEWMDFVAQKNKAPLPRAATTEGEQQQRPLFLERPRENWVHEYLIPRPPTTVTTPAKDNNDNTIDEDENIMNFHIFWRGPITDKLSLAAYSFLFTQPLKRARLNLWIDSSELPDGQPEDYSLNEYSAPFFSEPLSNFVSFMAWDQEGELMYSYGFDEEGGHHHHHEQEHEHEHEHEHEEGADNEGNTTNEEEEEEEDEEEGEDENMIDGVDEQEIKELQRQLGLKKSRKPVKPVALSDAARFLILNRNGGIYLDADVLLLKDMSPFYDAPELEFAYEWSNTGMYNTAILRLFKESTVARRILDGAKKREHEITKQQLMEELQHLREKQLTAGNTPNKTPEDGTVVTANSEIVRQRKIGRPSEQVESKLRRRSEVTMAKDEPSPVQLVEKREIRPDEIYHPARLRAYLRPQDSRIEGNGLVMMSPAFFDPLWLRIDGAEIKRSGDMDPMVDDLHEFPDVFSSEEAVCPGQPLAGLENDKNYFAAGPEVFASGAYAYHWHNSWLAEIEQKSWMGRLSQAYKDFVEGKRPNLYGE